MATHTLAPPKEDTREETRCRCGCAPCDDTCCRLECLVKPRFFCGQLLTDQDLKALVDWTADKFRLTRFRHGWGVVCGLDVRIDPKRPTGIIVAPGYAIDCCGHDVVVCEDARYDLAKYCPDERCGEPYAAEGEKPRREGYRDDQEEPSGTNEEEEDAVDDRMTRAVDVSIAYDEQGAEPKTTLGHCGCGHTRTCENSRTKEAYKLIVRSATTADDVVQKADEQFNEQLQGFADFASDVNGRRGNVRTRLNEWIEEHPLQEFGFVTSMIAQSADSDLSSDARLFALLHWLFLDYRSGLLRCRCYECEHDSGVPLARVWLNAADRAAGMRCHVVAVNWRPPYRRPLSPVYCRTLPEGCIDLTDVIWATPAVARRDLGPQAERVQPKRVTTPSSLAELNDAIKCARTLRLCGDEQLDMQILDAGPLFGERVVSFCPRTTQGRAAAEGRSA